MAYQTFDWEEAKAHNSAEKHAWLLANHNKQVSEDEYITAITAFRANDARPYNARRYGMSRLRSQYRQLVQKFGFFI